ncbi:MAG: CoB--CoM heterodisulfide reductase iron-sulfur subunit A family protein [Desulfobacteraceae bacterium]|nr:MAG: CoB--CoM heterodisulfide reductase iron-sulfur subunit A family protein [Desulfobacteraceae bacterium]
MPMRFGTETRGNPVMVVGGGVAGIVAALDLANAGRIVHLVEKEPNLGGQVAKLDKLYPTDHCAFCPLWTEIKKCTQHPKITVHTRARVMELTGYEKYKNVSIVKGPHFVDKEKCISCGRCAKVCPVEKELCHLEEYASLSHAVEMAWDHAYPPSYMINKDTCTRCGMCQEICPSNAIDLDRAEEEIVITVDDVIWATGFQEVDLFRLQEFGSGTHPDIMHSMEFETWISEAGPNRGNIRKKSDLSSPRAIAFIQCAGARDMRMFPYCSAVCCMHALKQAKWVNKRAPEIECAIFFADLRTVGKNYYEYAVKATKDYHLNLIRGRPGLILSLPQGGGLAIKYEDTMTQEVKICKFDMVILNGALRPGLLQMDLGQKGMPALDSHGFLANEKDGNSDLSCGFSSGPADVIESSIQASSAALKALCKKFKLER